MTITQETANLVDTLAHAASQIGSTPASAKINQLIVELLPTPSADQVELDTLKARNAEVEKKFDDVMTGMDDFQVKLAAILEIDPIDQAAIRAATEALKAEVDGFIVEMDAR